MNGLEEKGIWWLYEVSREHIDVVGKKCANLGEILKAGLPVPEGFAISIGLYEKFREKVGIDQEIRECTGEYLKISPLGLANVKLYQELSDKLRRLVESKRLPDDIAQEITTYYTLLCHRCQADNLAVSVRSAGAKSHPGQYETYLNVKGVEQLLQKVVKVWSSIYNEQSIAAMLRGGEPIEQAPLIGVCVLKMVPAKVAGVCFTVEPTSGDDSLMFIEASWGLGESVVSGNVTPDRFIVAKRDLKVLEKGLGAKESQVALVEQGVIKEELLSGKRRAFCLEDQEVEKVAELAKKLESYFGTPQDVEWAIDEYLPFPNNVILLQTRPQVGIPEKKTQTEKVLDLMMKKFK